MDFEYRALSVVMEKLFRNAGINESFVDFYNKLTGLRKTITEDKIRMQMVKEYLENL